MSFDLKNDAGLKAFNDALATQAFATGFVLSGDDAALFDSLKAAPDAKKFANVARWYKNVASYDKKVSNCFIFLNFARSQPVSFRLFWDNLD